MQFYIVHASPGKNIKLLPGYALLVNVTEGYQMLSDIGHLFKVSWETRNKCYSPFHAKTRTFWVNRQAFRNFIAHYEACLLHYKKNKMRQNKKAVYDDKYKVFIQSGGLQELLQKIPVIGTAEQQDAFYICSRKRKFLGLTEFKRINALHCYKFVLDRFTEEIYN